MPDRAMIALTAAVACLVAMSTKAMATDSTSSLYRDQPQQVLYRQDQPAVLTPSPTPGTVVAKPVEVPSPDVRKAFRDAYGNMGSPRLAVFWNRVFSDGLRDMAAGHRIVVDAYSAKTSGSTDKTHSERETDRMVIKEEFSLGDDARASPVTEIGEFRFQAGYLQPLIGEGANVIDRATIMRITDAERQLKDSAVPIDDRQLIETAALREHADLLIQIALSPSMESKTGVFFNVSVLEVQTGRIRASFFHDGAFPVQKSPSVTSWKAVKGGYIQVTEEQETAEPVIDLEQMGRILSEETMIALAGL